MSRNHASEILKASLWENVQWGNQGTRMRQEGSRQAEIARWRLYSGDFEIETSLTMFLFVPLTVQYPFLDTETW